MKKYIIKSVFLISVFLCIGCSGEEYLDKQPPDQLTSENFWRNAEDARSGLTAAYSELEARSNFWDGWQEGRSVVEYFRSDYALPGPDASNYSHWMSIYNFNYTNGHIFLDVLWSTNYKGINFSNQVIKNVTEMTADQISEGEKEQILGEAYFLRAYYHFKLLTLFEQIIIRDEVITTTTLDKALASRSEAWDFLLQDFETAANKLEFNIDPQDYGRANKAAALGYLGKAYMYKAGDDTSSSVDDYQKAADAFSKVIESGQYALEDDFKSLFNGNNENNKESIFELQFKSGDANSWNATRLHSFVGDWAIGGWGGIVADDRLVDKMKTEGMIAEDGLYDSRLYATLYFDDPYFNDESAKRMEGSTWDTLIEATYGDADAKDDVAFFRKWLPEPLEGNGYIGLNVTLLRYADVLLMYAEALNEIGTTGEAIELINKVRNAHGNMPPVNPNTKEAVFDQLVHERIMELSLESTRFFDLRRWGMLEGAMTAANRSGFSAQEHAYLPIPLSELQTNTKIE
ncbi:RagB/SusD family nutrient uptake outer membrane protein [Salegentibacter maritimus]|uniref:RagB/SusD family nutrient uptake outer membrane protein n=1 Tax=Salegentibacter maritimus TaxID=2794347 RepID=UPI0018E448B7|nr:RagB/SusD family nutrient uptake outer membrane protein [Salegentibacter maritimus]MBI6116769.1 RagB/SusD family nutrient uptake outer membrane protein [Salegentibacter maritimus]